MSERWLGKRKGRLRYVSTAPVLERELHAAAAWLDVPPRAQEEQMERTLARVLARARTSPLYAKEWSRWASIGNLEGLLAAPSISSNVLPTQSNSEPEWREWVTEGEPIVATAATSGSTGLSKLMPYTQRSLEHYAWSNLPSLARATTRFALPAHRVVLALTAPAGYVSHIVIPACFLAAGYDVLHIPLASVLNDPETALDLVDWLLEPHNEIHCISTVAAMLPVFISAFDAIPGGTDALDRLRLSLRMVMLGGSEVTPFLATLLNHRLGLRQGACVNLFASTEAGICAFSDEDVGLFLGSLHSHVLSIIPLEEREKAENDASYLPRGVLLTRAPVGLVGELASTFDAAVPWLNLRQGDVFEVAKPRTQDGVPQLHYLARASSVHDVGGGRVWPASYERAMSRLSGQVTDYLAMTWKPGELSPESAAGVFSKDALLFYYEGSASVDDVRDALLESIPILATTGPNLGTGTYDLTLLNVRSGALRRCRQAKSQERGGAPGPFKDKVVRGLQYNVPMADVVARAHGWTPTPRRSEIRVVSPQIDPVNGGQSPTDVASPHSRGKGSPG